MTERQDKLDRLYMNIAKEYSELSRARRLKVGACLVTKQGVTLSGYNGTPSGYDNDCEHITPDGRLVTKDEVIHAEMNCILKGAREGISLVDSTVYITHSPCKRCSAMLASVGVKRIFYWYEYGYGHNQHFDTLRNLGIEIEQLGKILEEETA